MKVKTGRSKQARLIKEFNIQHCFIFFRDDGKFGRREHYSGLTSGFKEKEGYKPNVKLDYIDDDGHVLNAKETFRYLSHEFHGKGPRKNKVEKRMKKTEQEGLKQMSSTDTRSERLASCSRSRKKCSLQLWSLVAANKHEATISRTKLQVLHKICWHQL